jgi:predicted secreted Zn-dependent protease
MTARWLVAIALLAGLLTGSAQAEVVSSTRVSYYTVSGSTPGAIFQGILGRGPQISGADAIASIATRAVQDGGLKKSGGACRLSGYRVRLTFLITRPRIANPRVLKPDDLAKWNQVNSFIIAHENQHKQNWLACAAALDRHLTAMSAPNCGQLTAKGEFMWKQMLAACDKRQRAFDSVQSWQLQQLPFMRRARNGAD